MNDTELLTAVASALPGMDCFHRQVYALAQLRVRQGRPLKTSQRLLLERLLRVARRAQQTFSPEGLDRGR